MEGGRDMKRRARYGEGSGEEVGRRSGGRSGGGRSEKGLRPLDECSRIIEDVSRTLTLNYGHLGGAERRTEYRREGEGVEAAALMSRAADVLLRVKNVLAGLEMERLDREMESFAARPLPDEEEEEEGGGGDSAAEIGEGGVPLAAHCPITHEVFKDPVITRYGHSYERSALEGALRTDAEVTKSGDWKQGARDPTTRRPLRWPGDIVTNRALRDVCVAMGWE